MDKGMKEWKLKHKMNGKLQIIDCLLTYLLKRY